MNTPTPTPMHRLADAELGDAGPLAEFVRTRRLAGKSWRLIARELYDATDGKIDITLESLRTWFADPAEQTAAAS